MSSSSHAIVIGSFVGSPWLAECVASLPRDIPVLVVCEPHYECGKIGWAYRHTTLDEFLFLPDTVRVKRHGWIREMFAAVGESIAVNNEPAAFGSFMGKYRRAVLDRVTIPHTPDKRSAVIAEVYFTRDYCAAETVPVRTLFPLLVSFPSDGSPPRFEEKFGRRNVVLENDDLIKYKGTFSGDMIDAAEARDRVLAGRLRGA